MSYYVLELFPFYVNFTVVLSFFLFPSVQQTTSGIGHRVCVCLFVCVFYPSIILDVRLVDVPAGVTQQQEEGHTGFLIHLPSALLALIFLARRIELFLSLVDRDVEFCVLPI